MDVVRLGSQEQVVGIDAEPVIAPVEYIIPRDFSVVDFPGQPVRQGRSVAGQPELPVSLSFQGTRPLPAAVSLGDMVPEPLVGRAPLSAHETMLPGMKLLYVLPTGLEPATHGSGSRCSIH